MGPRFDPVLDPFWGSEPLSCFRGRPQMVPVGPKGHMGTIWGMVPYMLWDRSGPVPEVSGWYPKYPISVHFRSFQYLPKPPKMAISAKSGFGPLAGFRYLLPLDGLRVPEGETEIAVLHHLFRTGPEISRNRQFWRVPF